MVVLDTNIIISHLRQRKEEKSPLDILVSKKPKEIFAISTITIQELYEGKSTQEEIKEQYLLTTIAPLRVLSYSYEIAKLAGQIARDHPRPIEFADSAIAATTIVNGAKLATQDKKDFRGIKDLELL